jgi:hypothetical protein
VSNTNTPAMMAQSMAESLLRENKDLRAEVASLKEEEAVSELARNGMEIILNRFVQLLHGGEPPDGLHDWHALPYIAAQRLSAAHVQINDQQAALKWWGDGKREGLESELAALKEQNALLAVQGQRVYAAADAVVKRWDTPLWKDVRPTAEFIYALRDALTALPQHVKSEDAELLDWLIWNEVQVWEVNGRYSVHDVTEHHPITEEFSSPREAIRAAISAQEEKA